MSVVSINSIASGFSVSVNPASRTQITATFNIDANTAGGNHAVTVKVGNQTSNSTNFFAPIPNAFTGMIQTKLPSAIHALIFVIACTYANSHGYYCLT